MIHRLLHSLLLSAALCVLASAGAQAACAPVGGLKFVCGVAHPEDLARLPGTRWLIASGFQNGAGLKLVDTQTGTMRFWYRGEPSQIRPDRRDYPDCAAAPDVKTFNAHGISLRAEGPGRYRLYVVNHGGRESIEVFDVDARGAVPSLAWKGCAAMPAGLAANSVASFADGTLIATVLTRPGFTYADFVNGRNTGGVYERKPGAKGFHLLPGTELPGNNGLETSRDGKEFYVVAYGTHSIYVYARGHTAKPLRHVVAPGFMPDNIHWDGDRLLTAGMTYDEPACGGVRKVINGVADPMRCHRGYVAAQLDPHTMKFTILAFGGPNPAYNGVTIAMIAGANIWLGSYQADRLAYRALPESAKSDEYLLMGSATRGAGEPMIAVDPNNPNDMVAVSMASVQHLGIEDAALLEAKGYAAIFNADPRQHFDGLTDAYHGVPHSTITQLAVTHDGGDHWKLSELPILGGAFTRCPDPFAAVLPDGAFLAGCEPRETSGQFFGKSAVVVSHDHGATWSRPTDIISSYGAARFAPGLAPRIGGNSPWDRPFLAVDDSSGVIYGVAEGGETRVSTQPDKWRWESFITASTDGGKHFGTIYAWDSKDFPELSRGEGVAAAHGAVAVAYVASSAPSSAGAHCPCTVFGLSRDQGVTFARHVLAGASAADPVVGLAADPTTAGRFALMRYVAKPSPEYQVAVSDDGGRTWSGFIRAGRTARATHLAKPWITYSPVGVLGLMWRAIYPDRSYDIWSSISKDGGHTFSDSLRVSHAVSPVANPYRNDGLFGDDIQDLVLDKDSAHLVWGDSRAGFQGIWYGSVPLAAYAFGKR